MYSGGSRGGQASPLFLDQTEAQRAEKLFGRPPPPPLFKGLDDQHPPPLPLSQGLDQALL